MKTKVTLPPVIFNYTFKSTKLAKQKAVEALMAMIEDKDVLKEIKVKRIK